MTVPQPRDLFLVIPGKPRTQGSLTLWRGGDGKERAKHSEHTANHRNLVVGLALQGWGRPATEAGVAVRIVARFARPASHYGTGRNAGVLKPGAPKWPTTRAGGDLDKVARLVLDALEIAGVYKDDSQVVALRAEKEYAETPCTEVSLWVLP